MKHLFIRFRLLATGALVVAALTAKPQQPSHTATLPPLGQPSLRNGHNAPAATQAAMAASTGPIHQVWVAGYNGPANNTDVAIAVAADAAGNVYVVGLSTDANNIGDYVTIKYDGATGQPLWTAAYNGPGASFAYDSPTGLALDGAGNAYVTGSSYNSSGNADIATIKYDATTGQPLWEARYDGSTHGNDGPVGIAVDAAGNAYVTGGSPNSSGNTDYVTLKYDAATGQPLWTAIYNGPANDNDAVRALALDAAGNVYVTGYSFNDASSYTNYVTIKYDAATGQPLWTAVYDGPTHYFDTAQDLAVDASGHVYVEGYSSKIGQGGEHVIIKYDAATGQELWEARRAGPTSSESSPSIAVDAAGNAYLACISHISSTYDIRTTKFDAATGQLLWEARQVGPTNVEGTPRLAVDAAGNAYVAGPSFGVSSSLDFTAVKYDAATGQLVWSTTYDGPTHLIDDAYAICLDAAGNVDIAGISNFNGSNVDFLTLKYSQLAPGPTVWSGTASVDWFNAANWTGGVPTATDNGVVPSGTPNAPTIGVGSAAVHDLTLNGSTLTLNGGTLDINGVFTNNGGSLVQTGAGGVAFTGTTPQVLGGSGGTVQLTSLTVGPAGATLSGPVQVTQTLTLQGNLVSNGNLVLLGDAGGTAMVIPSGTGTVIGAVTVQAYVGTAPTSRTVAPASGEPLALARTTAAAAAAGPDRYVHVASPVAGAAVAGLATAEYTPVVNPAFNTRPSPTATVAPTPTVFQYDELRATAGFWQGWQSPPALTAGLGPARGYALRLGSPTTLALTGPLNTGTLSSPPLSRTTKNGGWQLLGNPYPSLLDWRVLAPTLPASMGRALYVYDAPTGSFRYFVNGIGTPLVDVLQGFWVRVVGPIGGAAVTFNFTDAARTASVRRAAAFVPTGDGRPQVRLTVRTAAGTTDETTVYFDNTATAAAEARADAWKIPAEAISPLLPPSDRPVLASWAGTELLAVNGLPTLGSKKVSVPLSLNTLQSATCTLSATLRNVPAGTDVLLLDQVGNRTYNLRQAPGYAFKSKGGSLDERRLTLQLVPPAHRTAPAPEGLSVYPQPAQETVTVRLPATWAAGSSVRVQLVNAFGTVVLEQLVSAARPGTDLVLPVGGQRPGVYTLRVSTAHTAESHRITLD